MKKIFFYTVVLVGIPFFVVFFWKDNSNVQIKEISLNYLSNVYVRVKRVHNNNIQSMPLEEYIVGVVAGEMPVTFEMEALKAQSVASRSYVLKRILTNSNQEYDVVDTVSNQVYLDDNQLKERWKDKYVEYINRIREAVNDTSMQYLEYDGEVIDAMFFSTSNGYTEDSGVVFSSSLPYLKSVTSEFDEEVSPAFKKTSTMSLQEFYERLNLPYDRNLKIIILERSSSHRIIKLKINGTVFLGKDVYNRLGLRSCDFSIQLLGNNVSIETKGYGHGVGMSQYGAQGMAKNGFTYKDILSHYYVDTVLKRWENV